MSVFSFLGRTLYYASFCSQLCILLLTGFKCDTLYRIVLSFQNAAVHYVMARICTTLGSKLLSSELWTGLLQFASCWIGGSIWYHSGLTKPVLYSTAVLSQSVHGTATYRCDDTRDCIVEFWPPDGEHLCSKDVEA